MLFQCANEIHKCKGRALLVARVQFCKGLISAGPVGQGWPRGSAGRRTVGGSRGWPVKFGIARVKTPLLEAQGASNAGHRAQSNSHMQR